MSLKTYYLTDTTKYFYGKYENHLNWKLSIICVVVFETSIKSIQKAQVTGWMIYENYKNLKIFK